MAHSSRPSLDSDSNQLTEQPIPDRFRAQVRANSGGLAIAALDTELTYAQLDRRANAVARGIGSDSHLQVAPSGTD